MEKEDGSYNLIGLNSGAPSSVDPEIGTQLL